MPAKIHPRVEATEIDWARLAAYIDGEGCIDLRYKTKTKTFYLHMNITNTDFRLLVWLQNTFGGSVQFSNRKPGNWRPVARWYVGSKTVADVLRRCRPYLITKADQADLAIAFQETVFRAGVKGHSKETIVKRKLLKQQISALKWVGYDRKDFDRMIPHPAKTIQ